MGWCTFCGAADQTSRFCVNCGAPMAAADPAVEAIPHAPPTGPADTVLYAEPIFDPRQGPGSRPAATFGQPASPIDPLAPASSLPMPPKPPTPPRVSASPTPTRSRRRGWLIAGVAFLVVAALATTAVLVHRSGNNTTDQAAIASTSTAEARPAVSAHPSDSKDSQSNPPTTSRTSDTATSSTSPTTAQMLTCDGRTILITGMTQVSPQEAVTELSGAHLGTFAAGCYRPGETVAFYGPFTNPDDAFQTRLDQHEGTGEVITLDAATAGQYQSGLCALQRKYRNPPKLSTDPTTGTVESPWVAELVDYLFHGSYLPRATLGQTFMTATIAAAVAQFQHTAGLQADGIVGDATWTAVLAQACPGE